MDIGTTMTEQQMRFVNLVCDTADQEGIDRNVMMKSYLDVLGAVTGAINLDNWSNDRTRYERLAGTPERFADFFLKIYDSLDDKIVASYCQGMCITCVDDEVNCTDENLKKCILAWLVQEEVGHEIL